MCVAGFKLCGVTRDEQQVERVGWRGYGHVLGGYRGVSAGRRAVLRGGRGATALQYRVSESPFCLEFVLYLVSRSGGGGQDAWRRGPRFLARVQGQLRKVGKRANNAKEGKGRRGGRGAGAIKRVYHPCTAGWGLDSICCLWLLVVCLCLPVAHPAGLQFGRLSDASKLA